MKKKVVPKLRQEVKVKIDIVTSDDIKIYYTGKFQDFTARYILKEGFGYMLITSIFCFCQQFFKAIRIRLKKSGKD